MKFPDTVDIRSLAQPDLVVAINVVTAMFVWNIVGMPVS
jgi:hypothetical protein